MSAWRLSLIATRILGNVSPYMPAALTVLGVLLTLAWTVALIWALAALVEAVS